MTETEKLRRLLDERGVEWQDKEGPFPITAWESNDVIWVAKAYRTGVFSVETRPVTPEQAIAATLGSGECRTVQMDCFGNPPYNTSGLNGNSTACGCSECGAPWSTVGMFRGNVFKHNFKACPICGRKVVKR